MPLVPRRPAIRAQPVGFQLQIPPVIADPLGTLARALPFRRGPAVQAARQIVPLSQSVDKVGRPLVVAPEQETRIRCPPGYLAITMPDGSRACALAGVAISAGLASRRKKPLISVSETNAMRKAERARGKLKRSAERAGFKVALRSSTRRPRKTS